MLKFKIYHLIKILKSKYLLTKLRFFQFYLSCVRLKRIKENHNLNAMLIVSLTSYSPRFNDLHLTLISILLQKVKPNKIILWISEDEVSILPQKVCKLQKYGVEIKTCEDIKSYKKIIPTLRLFPDSFIITADDDIFYYNNWIEDFVNSYKQNPIDVIAYRSHKIKLNADSIPVEYLLWDDEVKNKEDSIFLFPTGAGGVFYSPRVFHHDILKSDIFLKLCPTADDVWLYWMHRLHNSKIRTLGAKELVMWYKSQDTALWQENTGEINLNDQAIKKMVHYYGFPVSKNGDL